MDQAHKLQKHRNEQHTSIEFTTELQEDNTLILRCFSWKKINFNETDVYRMSSFTELRMKLKSASPKTEKINLARCVIERALKNFF